jgi:hypothetical protein
MKTPIQQQQTDAIDGTGCREGEVTQNINQRTSQ